MAPLSLIMLTQSSSLALYPGDSRSMREYKLGPFAGSTLKKARNLVKVAESALKRTASAAKTAADVATVAESVAKFEAGIDPLSEKSIAASKAATAATDAATVAAKTAANATLTMRTIKSGDEPTDLMFSGGEYEEFELPNGDSIRYKRVIDYD